MTPPDTKLARLLAGRDRLSRPEKEMIFDAVAPQRRTRRPATLVASGLAIAAAATIAVLALRSPGHRGVAPDELTSRGGGGSFRIACNAAAPTSAVCVAGTTLAVEVTSTGGRDYFAVFAQRPDGAWVWYTPAHADGRSARLTGPGVLPLGIELDATHPPGRYRVLGVFSRSPLDRTAIRAAAALRQDKSGQRAPALEPDGDIVFVERVMVVR